MNRRIFLVASLAFAAAPALSSPRKVLPLQSVPGAKAVGSGRLSILMVPVFDATLYGPNGQWQPGGPAAIKLQYLTRVSGAGMAKHAVEQMRAVGVNDEIKLASWRKRMEAILPDVAPGACVFAVRDADGATAFYNDETRLGAISDPQFSTALFDICLSPRTSQPALRRHLLGTA